MMKSIITHIIILSFSFVLFSSDVSQAAQEQRLALVIGNSSYSFGPLKNPTNDAADMADALRKRGFTVILKKNANLRGMEEAVRDFGNRLKRGGVGLFYFAGHGLQVNGTNYLVPISARITKEADVKYETMDAGRILDEMANASNGLNIVILDACRDNPFSRRFRSASRGLAVLGDAPVGSFISYSTSPGQVALDGEGRNSPYASALLKYIQEPVLAIEQVFKNVRQRLGQETGGKQVPWELSSLQGDFSFDPAKPSTAGRSSVEPATREKPPAAAVARAPKDITKASQPLTYTDPTTAMEFILIKGGCFQMGDNFGDSDRRDERPVHEVCVDDFYMGKYEVTQGQWQKVMRNNPSHFKDCGENCPVESVSWTDVQSFTAELRNMNGQTYLLPSEAEWEYAARDGGKVEKWSGTSSEGKLGEYAWYEMNAEERTHPVGRKKPNALGLYDMSGNVWEWTRDWYGENYYQTSPRDNPSGPDDSGIRVLRGGCWLDRAKDCRSTIRFCFSPNMGFKSIGVRLVRKTGGSK